MADTHIHSHHSIHLPNEIRSVPLLALTSFLLPVILVLVVFYYTVLRSSGSEEAPVQFSVEIPEQCDPEWKGEVLEAPSIKVSGSTAIRCYCPANGRLLGLVNPASPDAIDRAIGRAQEAQTKWAKTSFKQRRRVLRTLLKYVLENQDSIATVACLDSGKTKVDASFGEILVTAEKLQWTIDHGERALSPERRSTNFLMMYKHNEVRWEPLGVVAAAVSWNYPFHMFISPFISSLFTGSALVLKASENTAWSTQHFAKIAKAALIACGHSPELIQPIVCWPQTANHLTAHPGISHITFIGSQPVAHHVAASAAKVLTPLCLELGGKDPAVVLDDVKDVNNVASILMRGTFQSAGQNCVGIERIICLPKIYPRLIAILEDRIRGLRVGSALEDENIDMGAMITNASFTRIESLISEAVSQGARCLLGGSRYTHPSHPHGHYFSPTLLVDVDPSMRIAQEEIFGPVCTVMRATSVAHAITLANCTSHALGASIYGTDRSTLQHLTRSINAGMISVNDFGVYHVVSLPFGGVRGSGYGRFGGPEGLRSICNTKSVCRDRWPGLISTSIPRALDYPYPNSLRAWDMCKGVVELGYAMNISGRVQGLWNIVRNG